MNPLFFAHDEVFDLTVNQQLRSLSMWTFWDKSRSRYVYVFPVSKAHQVVNLTRSLHFSEEEIVTLIHHSKQVYAQVDIESWKGKSGYSITELPTAYRIVSYEKNSKGEAPTKKITEIPTERVKDIWNNVFLKMDKDVFHNFQTIAPKVAAHFELNRYFREKSGSFDKAKFQGSRTNSDYGKFYYFPIKVLEGLGLVERKGQMLKRIKNNWEEQMQLSLELREENKQ